MLIWYRLTEAAVARGALPEHVRLPGAQGFAEQERLVSVQPQRPFVLVGDRAEGVPQALDHTLPSAIFWKVL
jgi:hypothetical protein